jgi:hypothetical protein
LLGALPLYGPFDGKLDNSSDSVELARPDTPNPTEVPFVLVDKVEYRDQAPWPPAADGAGPALKRLDAAAYGNDPANWVAAAPLTIIAHPRGLSADPGQDVVLSIQAIGTGPLRFAWRFNGALLPGATNDTLVLNNVQESNQGAYTATVSDLTGSIVSQPAFVAVLSPPYIIRPPQTHSVVQGGRTTLSIEAGGYQPLSFRWRRNATTLTNITQQSSLSFWHIEYAQSSDAGTYTVVLTNAVFFQPGILSPSAVLTVLADSDGDGMPDAWESANGFNPSSASDAEQDSDADGMINRDEYRAGTDPRNPESLFRIEAILTGAGVRIAFTAVSNHSYTVEYAADPDGQVWDRLEDIAADAANRTVEVSDTAGTEHPARTYRVVTPRRP